MQRSPSRRRRESSARVVPRLWPPLRLSIPDHDNGKIVFDMEMDLIVSNDVSAKFQHYRRGRK